MGHRLPAAGRHVSEAAAIGGLDVQLVYYRGLSECLASKWVSQPEQLSGLMERIGAAWATLSSGDSAHAKRETELLKVQALVFVGDAMEENPDDLSRRAELGRVGVPAFMFQEGNNREVERVFREIARLTVAPIAASIPAQHANWPSFCAPWRLMPPVG